MKIECLRRTRDGVIIDIEVTPNTGRERIKGYDVWRKRLLVDMKEKPEKFRVNRELLGFFAEIFQVPIAQVFLASGEKSTKKSVLIRGVDYENTAKIISEYL